MPHYKLTYFNIRALGEGARLIFHQAGVAFEDERVEDDDWPVLKPTTPFGQLPVLHIDGKEVIAQSAAIFRYLGKQFGLAGKTPIEEAQVDAIYDEWKDFFAETKPFFVVYAGVQKGDQKELIEKLVMPARDRHLPIYEKFLKQAGSGYLIGKSLTWADIVISDQLNSWNIYVPGFLKGHPELEKYVERIRSLPNIKKWVSERPETPI